MNYLNSSVLFKISDAQENLLYDPYEVNIKVKNRQTLYVDRNLGPGCLWEKEIDCEIA